MQGTDNQDIKDSVSENKNGCQANVLDSCIVTYGAVLRLELDDIPRLTAFINSLPNAKIIYSMKGVGHIRLVKE